MSWVAVGVVGELRFHIGVPPAATVKCNDILPYMFVPVNKCVFMRPVGHAININTHCHPAHIGLPVGAGRGIAHDRYGVGVGATVGTRDGYTVYTWRQVVELVGIGGGHVRIRRILEGICGRLGNSGCNAHATCIGTTARFLQTNYRA